MELTLATFKSKGVIDRLESIGMDKEDALREISFAIQAVQSNPTLSDCNPDSILKAVVNAGNIRLTLNPAAREAYLVPRYNRTTRSKEATLEPSYMGLIQLAIRAGGITSIVAHPVYENDSIKLDLANNTSPVIHKPELIKSKRGEFIGVYALATLTGGNRQAEWMDVEEVNAIRERSDSYQAYQQKKVKSCTWVSDYGEMARKTVVKRIIKYLPKSQTPHQEALQNAIQIDNQDYAADTNQLLYIEDLARVLEEKEAEILDAEIRQGMSRQAANAWINKLKAMQPPDDPRYGGGHSQKAIRQAVDKLGD